MAGKTERSLLTHAISEYLRDECACRRHYTNLQIYFILLLMYYAYTCYNFLISIEIDVYDIMFYLCTYYSKYY